MEIGMISTGDTAFILICAVLVAIMTPGVAFFYGGLVRRKNFLAIMMQSFISMGVVTAIWVLIGYSLVFSGGKGGVIGNLDWFALRGVGQEPGPWAAHIPAAAHFFYMEMFAIITPALITGAFADRVKFKSYLWFLALWSVIVYLPLAHMTWGGGLFAAHGVLDFAGGMVVHMSSGFAALASVFVVGSRHFEPGERKLPHNVAFVALGASLLWFGWYGFNGGSGLAADGVAAQALINTDIAGSIAMCVWLAIGWKREGKPSLLGALTGSVAGLVVITPCAGYVPTWSAFIIGFLAGVVCYWAVVFVQRMKWDDALDVWAVHGMGGLLGSVLLGVFAAKAVNPLGADGLLHGNLRLFGWQILASAISAGYSFGVTYVLLKLIDVFGSVRVPRKVELRGLDEAELGERAYNLT
jgi:Amt family ammonium transporter